MLKVSESQIQRAVVQYIACRGYKDYLLHIPNGGYRNRKEGANLKRLGVTAGVSDLFLAYPHNGYHGLWMEVKSKKGKLSEKQESWLKRMNKLGYKADVCYTFEEAILVVDHYLHICWR